MDSPFEELQKLAGDAKLSYAEGYPEDDSFDQDLIDEAVKNASNADVALLYIALPKTKESEGYDRADLDLTPQQVALIKAVTAVQPNTIVILNNGAPVVMSEWIDSPAAVLEAWMMGQAGGRGNCRRALWKGQSIRQAGGDFPAQAGGYTCVHQLPRRKR